MFKKLFERKIAMMNINKNSHDMHALVAASENFYVVLVRFFAGLFSFAKFYFFYFTKFKLATG